MKILQKIFMFCLLFWAFTLHAQVGIGTSTPHATAQLEVNSETKGILVPRMTGSQKFAIIQPAEGLLVFQIDGIKGFYYFQNGQWILLGASNWEYIGNDIANSNNGNVGIGTIYPSRKLEVIGDAMINQITIGRGGGNSPHNTAIGENALNSNTTGSVNTAIGKLALSKNIGGNNNTAVGDNALSGNLSGNFNTAVGTFALLKNTDGYYNTAIGSFALQANTSGYENTAVGWYALSNNTTGNNNSAVGRTAMNNNTTGRENVAHGRSALFRNTTGNFNTATGKSAMFLSTIGDGNTAHGDSALFTNFSGSYNTALGYKADVSIGTLTNATALGYGAVVNASNKVRIGNSDVTVIEGQVAFSFPSDGRFKTNISETVQGLDFIRKLRPVVYNFQTAKYKAFTNGGVLTSNNPYSEISPVRQSGFIAQEVEAAANASGYEFNGVNVPQSSQEAYSLSYSQFVVPLVKSVQELDENNKKMAIEMDKLSATIEDLKIQLAKLTSELMEKKEKKNAKRMK